MKEPQNDELNDYCHYSDLPSPNAYKKPVESKLTFIDLNISDDDFDDDYYKTDEDDSTDYYDDDDY